MDINLVSISAQKWELRILVAKTIAASYKKSNTVPTNNRLRSIRLIKIFARICYTRI